MKKIICLFIMIFLFISNIYCGEEDAVESLIEAIETERKFVLQNNDYEIIDEEEKGSERGWEGVLIKILNEDIIEKIKSKMFEEFGIIYINNVARFVNDIYRKYDPIEDQYYDILIDAIKMEYAVILQENDYSIFNINNGYLTIVILNENIMKRIKEAFIPPPIFIYINGSVKFIKGMGTYESSRPYPPCDYIYMFEQDRKARFDYGILLRLRPWDFVERKGTVRQTIFLTETDYEILSEGNRRLTIKILNKDKLKEIKETIDPAINFKMNNDTRYRNSGGIKTSVLEAFYPCNYTFKINANNKVIFSNLMRDTLVLTPIEEHIVKYIETLNIQYILNDGFSDPSLNEIFKGMSVLKDKEQMNDIIFKIFSIMGAVGGLSFLIFLIVKLSTQEKKARQINELRCGFEVHCGGQFDSITLSYPLVKIRLEETAIFIQYTGVSILLYIQDIKTVDIIGDLFMGGIKIEHNVSNYPKGIRLFTPYYKLLYKFISTRQKKD